MNQFIGGLKGAALPVEIILQYFVISIVYRSIKVLRWLNCKINWYVSMSEYIKELGTILINCVTGNLAKY